MMFLDIETLRAENTNIMRDKTVLDKSALSPHYGKIFCIGLVRPNGPIVIYGNDEKSLLQEFWKLYDIYCGHYWTWNGTNFDIPVLKIRSLIHGINRLNAFQGDHMDMRALWHLSPELDKICGRVGLDEVAKLCGISGKTNHGSNVQAMWADGLYRDIADYCLQDCHLVRQLWYHINGARYRRSPDVTTYVEV